MRATIQRWGNSLAVRIPKAFAEETQLSQGAEVDLSILDGNVVLAPLRKPHLELADLLEKVSPENLHSAIDWGTPRGKESL